MPPRATRLAPSPTGDLHLGNLRTFALTWAMARTLGWRLALRLEDLDAPRVRRGAVEATCNLLAWLGFDHDPPTLRQSADLAPYRSAMRRLAEQGLVYACTLSRSELRAAMSAPHRGDAEMRCPPELRPKDPERWRFEDERVNYRFATPRREVVVEDGIAGVRVHRPHEEVGDFVVWTKGGAPSYQLAVCVDDARQGVTDVIRGDDLLSSAARQTLLHEALGQSPPRWWHVPLVFDAQGRRLAKRHDDRSAAAYRAAGVPPERILGLLGWWLGLVPARRPVAAAELRELFAPHANPDTLAALALRPVSFSEEDHRWLLDPTP